MVRKKVYIIVWNEWILAPCPRKMSLLAQCEIWLMYPTTLIESLEENPNVMQEMILRRKTANYI